MAQDSIESFKVGTHTVHIHQDTDPESPREWDNLGTMVCFHNRYNLGDKHNYRSEDFTGFGEIAEQFEKDHGPCIILSLYLYDHSGITMRCSPFTCPWDSGQVGLYYIPLSKIRSEYSVKRVSAKLRERVTGYLENEVSIYDDYLTGSVYGFVVEDAEGEHIDSCWSFYGFEDCKEQGHASAEHYERKNCTPPIPGLESCGEKVAA